MVKKELFTFFRCRFTIDVPGPNDYEAEGDFLDMEYSFNRGSQRVAQVSKKWFRIRDTYGVEVAPDQEAVVILAVTVALDQMAHS